MNISKNRSSLNLLYILHSLFIILFVIFHFYSNKIDEKLEDNTLIPIMFDNIDVFNKFNSSLIQFLNDHDLNNGRYSFNITKDGLINKDIGIYVMVEQHRGFNLKERESYLKSIKEKMNSLMIIALRYGKFPSTLKDLSLKGFDIIELLYIDDKIIKDSDRNDAFMNKMFNWIERVNNQ